MVETFTVHITPYDLDRNTFIYLPDNWQTSGKRYPVIYMFDGHNLFSIIVNVFPALGCNCGAAVL